jgi:hypothetical protein
MYKQQKIYTMINKLLFWILTRVYCVNPDFVNPVNWRVANKAESISAVLGYNPLIFQGWKGKPQYGFENIIFMANGKVYLAPNQIPESYPQSFRDLNGEEISDIEKTISKYRRDFMAFSLIKTYMELDPHIVVKKFPTKLLKLLLQRHIPITKHMINQKIQSKGIPFDMTVEQAIREDLSKQPVVSTIDTLKKANTDMWPEDFPK